jgi:hypothetical protein
MSFKTNIKQLAWKLRNSIFSTPECKNNFPADFLVRKGVVVQLVGGLANQMICYKLGRYLSRSQHRTLILDASFYKTLPENSNRNLQLLHHEVHYDIFFDAPSFANKLLANRTVTSITGEPFHSFEDTATKQKALNLTLSDSDFLVIDIWSSLTLREIADTYAKKNNILAELRVNPSNHFDQTNMEFLEKIKASENPVAIHVRRGDYGAEGREMLLTDTYYNRAIVSMESRLSNPCFFIFSDDISWCRSHLRTKSPIAFMDFNDERHGYRDLALASRCKHFIMSSLSTFSHQILELSEPSSTRIVIHSSRDDLEVKEHCNPIRR